MNKAQRVRNTLNAYPDASGSEIAKRVGCSPSYVHLIRNKMDLRPAADPVEPAPAPDKPSINAILNERATTYGHFYMQAELSQALKNTIMAHLIEAKKTLVADQQEALEMILTKIARITNGNSNHVDSWDDIAGYARLVADRLRGVVR